LEAQREWLTPKQISAYPFVQKKDGQIVPAILDPRHYWLRALLTDAGLSLSLAEWPHHNIGQFYLADDHGEVSVLSASGYIPEIGPVPYFNKIGPVPYADRNYMRYGGDSQLTLSISTDKDVPHVPVLGTAPGYNLLPLNQYYPHPLWAPYFYQDGAGVYFIRSREGIEKIVRQVEVPDHAALPHFKEYVEMEKYDVRHDLGRPTARLIETAVVNPWVSAERELASQKIHGISTQSGLKP
jgi:hypothetical protein